MSLQGSQSQLRVGVSDPPCGCEAKRTSTACLRNQPEGPGPVGQGPNTLHRSLAMELRRQWASPAGCRGQLRLAISGRNGRSGARVDAHRQRKLALDYPTAHPHAPRSLTWRDERQHPGRRAPVRWRARISQRGHPRACPEDLGSQPEGTSAASPLRRQPGFSGQARE